MFDVRVELDFVGHVVKVHISANKKRMPKFWLRLGANPLYHLGSERVFVACMFGCIHSALGETPTHPHLSLSVCFARCLAVSFSSPHSGVPDPGFSRRSSCWGRSTRSSDSNERPDTVHAPISRGSLPHPSVCFRVVGSRGFSPLL